MGLGHRLILASMLVTLAACSGAPGASPTPSSPNATRCHARSSGDSVLPDPACTPGVSDPRVTPQTVNTTICSHASWSKMVRPPVSYTEPLKKRQMQEYGFTDSPSAHEEDHLISLELGGDPRDPHNLWPEPGQTPNLKDRVENKAHTVVCAHPDQLPQAQHAIASDWVAYGKQLGVL